MFEFIRRKLLAVSCILAFMSTAAIADPLGTQVTLPQDEAPHHTLMEWWYFVGNLSGVDPSGHTHKYGYEVCIFQVDSMPPLLATYSAHFAITDITNNTYQYEERVASAPIPNQVNRFDLAVTDWTASGSAGAYTLHAALADQTYSLQLNLQSALPPVLHGTNGIVPYGSLGTSAYYSYTSLATTGTITDHGVPISVTGASWQDRQWGNYNITVPSGWNWFSIQLTGNVQYMLYFLQDSAGNVVQKLGTKVVNGVASAISASQMTMTPLAYWTSPKTAITYPSQWQVTVPGGSLTVTPVQNAQELAQFGHRIYFEGDSTISGTLNGLPTTGVGYTEVNPYFEPYTSLP